MHLSLEAAIMQAVAEADLDGAQWRLSSTLMSDDELIEFYGQLVKTIDLVIEEVQRRGLLT